MEGGEGVGKSTQLARLADCLRAQGKTVITTREPGGTPGAEAIRDLLMTGSTDRWSARVETLLFAAARADYVERVIRPALDRGEWVLCDRFIDSTRAYQGGAGGVFDDEIMQLHLFGSNGLLPDRTLLLALVQNEAAARAIARDGLISDRFGEKNADYHARLGAAFEAFAQADPHRFRRIEADGTVDVVTARLLDALVDLL